MFSRTTLVCSQERCIYIILNIRDASILSPNEATCWSPTKYLRIENERFTQADVGCSRKTRCANSVHSGNSLCVDQKFSIFFRGLA